MRDEGRVILQDTNPCEVRRLFGMRCERAVQHAGLRFINRRVNSCRPARETLEHAVFRLDLSEHHQRRRRRFDVGRYFAATARVLELSQQKLTAILADLRARTLEEAAARGAQLPQRPWQTPKKADGDDSGSPDAAEAADAGDADAPPAEGGTTAAGAADS